MTRAVLHAPAAASALTPDPASVDAGHDPALDGSAADPVSDGAASPAPGEETPDFLQESADDHPEIAALKANHLQKWRDERRKQAEAARGTPAQQAEQALWKQKAGELDRILAGKPAAAAGEEPAAPTRRIPRGKLNLPKEVSEGFQAEHVNAVEEIAAAMFEQHILPMLAPYGAAVEDLMRGRRAGAVNSLEEKYGKEFVDQHRDEVSRLTAAGLTPEKALHAASDGQSALVARERAAGAPRANAAPTKTTPSEQPKKTIFGAKNPKTGKYEVDKAGLARHLGSLPGARELYAGR